MAMHLLRQFRLRRLWRQVGPHLAAAPLWLALSAGPGPVGAQTSQAPARNDAVLATVDKESIRLEEIEDREIHELRERLHEAMSRRLHRVAVERLARRHRGISLEPPEPVNEAQVREFYVRNGLETRGTYEQLHDRIRQHLQEQQRQAYLEKQFSEGVRRGWIKSNLHPPGDFLISVSTASAYIRGNPKAKVMLVEFSDFQCPFCERAQPTLTRLRQLYEGRVAFAYRHFPLPFHTEADEAALAVECARDQDRFEPYHALLFENRAKQYVPDLKRYAVAVQMPDQASFERCLTDKKHQQRLNADIEDGMAIGVSGTPTFIVGGYDERTRQVRGELFSGALPEQEFVARIDKYLLRIAAD
ncbi:MAG: thioredoxin domain-containing protein [Candidatus Lambdaproteobacteria bacterium]|nr:thioredoxin domain-containing protein [Candidatus Lambdaproteobacteria bacterium]